MTAIMIDEIPQNSMTYYTSSNYDENTEEENRVSISVLLPEQFSHSINLSVDKRTPALDLLVYVSSLFRFNPADYVLGIVELSNQSEFKVLRPNSCIDTAGSSVLRIAQKKQVMNSFVGEGGCLRYTYCNRNGTIGSKKLTIREGNHDAHLNMILPDGRNILINQPEDATLGQLFINVCDKYHLDSNCYSLQVTESYNNRTNELVGLNSKLSTLRNRTFQMIPALKSCDLAESENSVDRMSKKTELQFRQKNTPVTNSILTTEAVKALVAGTMMSDVTEGLGLNQRNQDVGTQLEKRQQKTKFTTVDELYTGWNRTYDFDSINQSLYYPQHQNTLDISIPKMMKKQRAPLPPALRHKDKQHTFNQGKHSLPLNNAGIMSYRNARVSSACSTLDDISEDFRQVIQLGSVMSNRCDKAAQTQADFIKAKPFFINQEIQTSHDLLTEEDKNYISTFNSGLYDNPLEFVSYRSQTSPHNIISIIRDVARKGEDVCCQFSNVWMPASSYTKQDCTRKLTKSTQSELPNTKAAKKSSKKKGFLELIQGKSAPIKIPHNIVNIITEQDKLAGENQLESMDPIELEVTEKTTVVECTVTVMAEGKSLSAVTRPVNGLADNVMGPRQYSKQLEFRKLNFDEV